VQISGVIKVPAAVAAHGTGNKFHNTARTLLVALVTYVIVCRLAIYKSTLSVLSAVAPDLISNIFER